MDRSSLLFCHASPPFFSDERERYQQIKAETKVLNFYFSLALVSIVDFTHTWKVYQKHFHNFLLQNGCPASNRHLQAQRRGQERIEPVSGKRSPEDQHPAK